MLGLNLLPFAGIAFLWFVGVVRDRIGEGEDRFFATVFLGSGLGSAPRWLTVLGFATGACLMFSAGLVPWVELVFPAWVFVLSVYILVASFRSSDGAIMREPAA